MKQQYLINILKLELLSIQRSKFNEMEAFRTAYFVIQYFLILIPLFILGFYLDKLVFNGYSLFKISLPFYLFVDFVVKVIFTKVLNIEVLPYWKINIPIKSIVKFSILSTAPHFYNYFFIIYLPYLYGKYTIDIFIALIFLFFAYSIGITFFVIFAIFLERFYLKGLPFIRLLLLIICGIILFYCKDYFMDIVNIFNQKIFITVSLSLIIINIILIKSLSLLILKNKYKLFEL